MESTLKFVIGETRELQGHRLGSPTFVHLSRVSTDCQSQVYSQAVNSLRNNYILLKERRKLNHTQSEMLKRNLSMTMVKSFPCVFWYI